MVESKSFPVVEWAERGSAMHQNIRARRGMPCLGKGLRKKEEATSRLHVGIKRSLGRVISSCWSILEQPAETTRFPSLASTTIDVGIEVVKRTGREQFGLVLARPLFASQPPNRHPEDPCVSSHTAIKSNRPAKISFSVSSILLMRPVNAYSSTSP
jgi:hypothetical protein